MRELNERRRMRVACTIDSFSYLLRSQDHHHHCFFFFFFFLLIRLHVWWYEKHSQSKFSHLWREGEVEIRGAAAFCSDQQSQVDMIRSEWKEKRKSRWYALEALRAIGRQGRRKEIRFLQLLLFFYSLENGLTTSKVGRRSSARVGSFRSKASQ